MKESVFRRHARLFSLCALLIQVFYGLAFFHVFENIPETINNLRNEIQLVPALRWLNLFGISPEFYRSLAYLAISTMLPAFFWPHSRAARILAALTLVVFFGFWVSFGNRQSASQVFIWIAMYLVFLPNWRRSATRRIRQRVIFGWWMCTGLFLMTYVLSGLWKVAFGMIWDPLINGEGGAWSPLAMGRVIATYVLRTNQPTWWGQFFMDYPWLGWPGYLGAIGLEVSAVLPLFLPRLYRPYAVMLLVFHIFSVYLLHIAFAAHILLIILMLYFSPFAERADYAGVFRWLARRLKV